MAGETGDPSWFLGDVAGGSPSAPPSQPTTPSWPSLSLRWLSVLPLTWLGTTLRLSRSCCLWGSWRPCPKHPP